MIKRITIVLVALVVVLGAAAGYLAGTAGGAVALIAFGENWLPGRLVVADLRGSFAAGLEAGQVEYRQDELVVLASNASLAIDLAALLRGTLVIEEATVESFRLSEQPIDAEVRVTGSAEVTPSLPLDVAVEWVDRPTAIRGRGTFVGTLQSLNFAHVVEMPEPLYAEGTITDVVDAPAVSASLTWERLTLPEQDFGALVSRDGVVQVEASAAGYRAAGNTQVIRDQSQQASVALSVHGTTEQLIVDALEVGGFGGELSANGTVGLGEPPVVLLQVTGTGFDPGLFLPGYDGRLSFDAEVDARWPERLTANISRLDGTFRGSRIRGVGELRAVDGQLQRASARLRSGDNSIDLDVVGQPRLAGNFEIDAPALSTLWPGLTGELRGSGSLTGTREAPQIAADLTGVDIGFRDQSIGRLRIVGKANADSGVDFDARADAVRGAGQELGDLVVDGSGTIDAHALRVRLSGGLVETNFDVDGSWDGTTLTEQLHAATIDTEIGAWQLRERLTVAVTESALRVSANCWDSTPASICIDAFEARDDSLVAGAILSRFPLQTLNAWLGEDIAVEGEADAILSFERSGEEFSAVIDWQQSDTRIVFESSVEEMMVESEVETRLSSLQLKLVVDEELAELTGTVVGTFGLTADVEARLKQPLEDDGALSGSLQAEVPDIGELRPLVDRYVPTEGLVGALLVDIRLGGTRDAPTLDGGARLRDAAATVPLFGITVEDIDVEVLAGADDNLVVKGSARSGEGVVDLSGVIGIADDTGLYAEIALKGDRFQLVRLPDQSAFISPDVTARFDGGQIALDGRVLVPEAAFQFVELGASAVAMSDDVVIHVEGEAAGETASFTRIAGQLEIELGDAVTFEGLGLETRLTGGLILTFRPGEQPAGEGSFQLVDGTFEALGREMLVERGSLNFFGPLDDPVIEARATRRLRYENENIKVGINLSGRVSQQLNFVLFSEPAMSDADVLSFMVVGRPSLGEGDNSASGAALALGLQSLTGGTGDKTTLDEISFEGGGADDTSVVAGKKIGDRWYIRYTYGLFNRVGTFIIRYDIGRGVSIEAGSGVAHSLDLIYSIDREGTLFFCPRSGQKQSVP
ncbi:MAG: translocation/assembly module TamB domain-containing protein [Gammaproteobacteria bacterium]